MDFVTATTTKTREIPRRVKGLKSEVNNFKIPYLLSLLVTSYNEKHH